MVVNGSLAGLGLKRALSEFADGVWVWVELAYVKWLVVVISLVLAGGWQLGVTHVRCWRHGSTNSSFASSGQLFGKDAGTADHGDDEIAVRVAVLRSLH